MDYTCTVVVLLNQSLAFPAVLGLNFMRLSGMQMNVGQNLHWLWDNHKKKKISLKRELMTVPTRLRRASFILDSDTLNPAYLEHSNKTKILPHLPCETPSDERAGEGNAGRKHPQTQLGHHLWYWCLIKMEDSVLITSNLRLKHTLMLTSLPTIQEILDWLAGSEVFFTIDPESLYWQCPNGWSQQR